MLRKSFLNIIRQYIYVGISILKRYKRKIFITFIVCLLVIFAVISVFPKSDFTYISVNSTLASLVYKTIPELMPNTNVSSCDYTQIIRANQFVYLPSYRGKLSDSHNIRPGGEYIPSHCNPKFSTAVIVPYRNRSNQLTEFLIYMHNFLRQQSIHYRIFIVEQIDQKPFNRAKLFNVGGLKAIDAKFPCLIFHDVDLFPMNLGNLYVCTNQTRHMTVNMDIFDFKVPYEKYFGGGISMLAETFQLINGMSNVYFGWGGEDDDLFERLRHKNIDLIRFGPDYSQYSMIKHKPESKSSMRYDLLRGAIQRSQSDGLNSLEYKNKEVQLLQLYTHIKVEF